MPLSANVPLFATPPAVAVELFWDLLQRYRTERFSGSPAEYLCRWPTRQEVENFRVVRLGPQGLVYGSLIDVAGAVGRVLYRPIALDNPNNVSPTPTAKIFIYTRSKTRTRNRQLAVAQTAAWNNAFRLQNRPALHGFDHQLGLTCVVLPRQLPLASEPFLDNTRPFFRYGFFNYHARHSFIYEGALARAVFTILPKPNIDTGLYRQDDRPDGSPSMGPTILIQLILLPEAGRHPHDRFVCTFRVRIMQNPHGQWVPWQPPIPVLTRVKDEPQVKEDPDVKREPERTPSPAVKQEPVIKQEPEAYALSHRQRAIYGQNQARRLI